jgi:hypothetical protein
MKESIKVFEERKIRTPTSLPVGYLYFRVV